MDARALRDLLEPYGVRPLRDRGQHFLLDDRVVARIVEAAKIAPGDRVVEIGPGPGILTAALLAKGAEVVAIELDLKLQALLRDRFGAEPRFRLCEGDALGFPNADIVSRFSGPAAVAPSYKMVANLPYNITSDALRKFLREEPTPSSVTVMIQREVADRILAAPGDMSALAVFVRTFGDVVRVVNVPAGAFLPPPKVDSAVIHIARKSRGTLEEFFRPVGEDRYFSVVRSAFAGKRKQLRNSLKGLAGSEKALNEAFLRAGIAPERRPEELSVEQWRSLASVLT